MFTFKTFIIFLSINVWHASFLQTNSVCIGLTFCTFTLKGFMFMKSLSSCFFQNPFSYISFNLGHPKKLALLWLELKTPHHCAMSCILNSISDSLQVLPVPAPWCSKLLPNFVVFEPVCPYIKQASMVPVCLQTLGLCTWSLPSATSFLRAPAGTETSLVSMGGNMLGENGREVAERGMVMETVLFSSLFFWP